jgi:hypothetical protein
MKNGAKRDKMTTRETSIEPSSGNVFTDLGVADPQGALAKAQLAQRTARCWRTGA